MQRLHSRGERGSSVLASLVIAATLGGAALVADFGSAPQASQTAAGILAADVPAPTKTTPVKTEKTAEQLAERKAQITQQCTEAIKRAQLAKSGNKTTNFKTQKEAKGQVTDDNCIAVVESSDAAFAKTGGYKCVGKSAQVTMKSDGTLSINWQANPSVQAGTCKTLACQPRSFLQRQLPTYGSQRCFISELDSINKSDVVKNLDSKGFEALNTNAPGFSGVSIPSHNLSPAEADILKTALGLDPNTDLNNIPMNANGDPAASSYDQIKKFADAKPNEQVEQFAKEVSLNENLADAKRCDYQGPCQHGQMDPCTGKCPVKTVTPPPGPPAPPPSTFPPAGPPPPPQFTADKGPWGQQTMGQPPPGNQSPRPPGTCSAGQTLCSGNTLYSRNNQCVDTVVQYCQYGCAAQQQSSGSSGVLSGILSMFGGGGGAAPQSGQCAPPPQQGGNCPQAPAQPTTECANGQWKPTYGPPPNTVNTGQATANNTCVIGWQCVPTGSAQLKAEISCEPKVGDAGTNIAVSYTCSAGTSEGSGFSTDGARSGATTVTLQKPPGNTNTATYTLKCIDGTQEAKADCSVQVSKASIVLIANPEAVRRNETSRIGWITSGMRSCVISSPDDDEFTEDNEDNDSVNGTAVSEPLRRSTEFVLTCETQGGATKEEKIEVNVI